MKYALQLFLYSVLVLPYTHAQKSDTTTCKAIAKYLSDSLVYPMMEIDNAIESKHILWCVNEGDSIGIRNLRRPNTYMYRFDERTLRKAFKQYSIQTCNCIFVIDYDIVYLDSTRVSQLDTLLVSADSIQKVMNSNRANTFYVKVEHGRAFQNKLDSLYEDFEAGKIPLITETEEMEYSGAKEYGVRPLGKSEDSLVIRIWDRGALYDVYDKLYQIGCNAKGQWYAKSYNEANGWQIINAPQNVLRDSVVSVIERLPYLSRTPCRILDGTTFHIEIKSGSLYRHFTISNPKSCWRDYGFWTNDKFLQVMKILESR